MVWTRQTYPVQALLYPSVRTARLSRQQKNLLCADEIIRSPRKRPCDVVRRSPKIVQTHEFAAQFKPTLLIQGEGTPVTTRLARGTFGICTSSRNRIHWKPALPISTLMNDHEPYLVLSLDVKLPQTQNLRLTHRMSRMTIDLTESIRG